MLRGVLPAALLAVFAFTTSGSLGPPPSAAGDVVVVKMVDVSPTEYRFEPDDLTVQPGDTVRFEQAGVMPHNVEFRDVPAATNLGSAKMGPYLTSKGETYDLLIDARFGAGLHKFVCTPHESLGMRGTLLVGDRE